MFFNSRFFIFLITMFFNSQLLLGVEKINQILVNSSKFISVTRLGDFKKVTIFIDGLCDTDINDILVIKNPTFLSELKSLKNDPHVLLTAITSNFEKLDHEIIQVLGTSLIEQPDYHEFVLNKKAVIITAAVLASFFVIPYFKKLYNNFSDFKKWFRKDEDIRIMFYSTSENLRYELWSKYLKYFVC